MGKMPIHLNTSVTGASIENGAVQLQLTNEKGAESIEVDHVIAATGYRVDLQRLEMLPSDLRGEIRLTGESPLLSSHFESSVPGLYFVGVASANTFGPLMRFACGAEFTAPRLARHLAKAARKSPVHLPQPTVQRQFE